MMDSPEVDKGASCSSSSSSQPSASSLNVREVFAEAAEVIGDDLDDMLQFLASDSPEISNSSSSSSSSCLLSQMVSERFNGHVQAATTVSDLPHELALTNLLPADDDIDDVLFPAVTVMSNSYSSPPCPPSDGALHASVGQVPSIHQQSQEEQQIESSSASSSSSSFLSSLSVAAETTATSEKETQEEPVEAAATSQADPLLFLDTSLSSSSPTFSSVGNVATVPGDPHVLESSGGEERGIAKGDIRRTDSPPSATTSASLKSALYLNAHPGSAVQRLGMRRWMPVSQVLKEEDERRGTKNPSRFCFFSFFLPFLSMLIQSIVFLLQYQLSVI